MAPANAASPDQRNRSLRCEYHRDHDHETNQCQSLKFLVEKLIRVGHLRRFIREPSHGTEIALAADRAIVSTEHPSEPRPTINYVLGGPIDDQYQSKKKRRKMLRVATVRAKVNTIRNLESSTAVQSIDDPHILSSYKPDPGHHSPLRCTYTHLMY